MSGISFILRVRDEESSLEKSIRSLFGLTIPYEIVVILHCCTDGSPQIAARLAEENQRIRVVTYDHALSRAGYETLATDVTSVHSLSHYYTYCFSLKKYAWSFKWDADFIATDELIAFLNSKSWAPESALYRISASNSTSNNIEGYLSGCTHYYLKYMFWEVPFYEWGYTTYTVDPSIYIRHESELADLKSYWKADPWYLTEDTEEATIVRSRIERLRHDFGDEPEGMARASNPICNDFQLRIMATAPTYVNVRS